MSILLSLLLTFVMTTPVSAAFDGPGAAPVVKDSASAATAAKDSPDTLEGNLVRKVKDELYLFKDGSGEVLVEIDDDLMTGRNITPENKVRLHGDVDREDGRPSIEVETLEVLN